MKTLIAALILAITSQAHAAMDCSQNSYRLTTNNLVVAYDFEANQFSEATGINLMGNFFFNNLRDASCAQIVVPAGKTEVFCRSTNGQLTSVGFVQGTAGRYQDFQFLNVNWKSNVVIKSQYSDISGCAYGPAVR